MPQHETQTSIIQWCRETFGQEGTLLRTLFRTNEEMAELLTAVDHNELDEIPEEAADVAILLCLAADRVGSVVYFDSCNSASPQDTFSVNACLANQYLAQTMQAASECQRIEPLLVEMRPSSRGLCAHYIRITVELLETLCLLAGTTLQAATDAKMAINRSRNWTVTNGYGHHVETDAQRPTRTT